GRPRQALLAAVRGWSTRWRKLLSRRYKKPKRVETAGSPSHLCSRICETEYTLTAAIACFQYQTTDRPSRYCSTRSPASATSAQKRSSSQVATTGGCSDLIQVLLPGPTPPAPPSSPYPPRPPP